MNFDNILPLLTLPGLNSLLGTNNKSMPSKLLKNSSISFLTNPLAGSNIVTCSFFILCITTKWLKPSSVITWAIAGRVYLLLNPSLSTLTALVSNPKSIAPFSNPLSVVPLISVPSRWLTPFVSWPCKVLFL